MNQEAQLIDKIINHTRTDIPTVKELRTIHRQGKFLHIQLIWDDGSETLHKTLQTAMAFVQNCQSIAEISKLLQTAIRTRVQHSGDYLTQTHGNEIRLYKYAGSTWKKIPFALALQALEDGHVLTNVRNSVGGGI